MSRSTGLQLQNVAIGDLKNNARNARTHTKHQVLQIADSIKAFGFTNPVLLDKDKHDYCRPWPRGGGEAAWHLQCPHDPARVPD